jgi:hypothetical protein
MQTTTAYIKYHHIKMDCEEVCENPNMEDFEGYHYKCILRAKGKQLTTFFSMGLAHEGKEPQIEEVLDCLASDASGYENAQGFEDWCNEYGYSTDSKTAEKIWKAVEKGAKKLKNFLGDEYKSLLWETERY